MNIIITNGTDLLFVVPLDFLTDTVSLSLEMPNPSRLM
jgi:hypothetical protein